MEAVGVARDLAAVGAELLVLARADGGGREGGDLALSARSPTHSALQQLREEAQDARVARQHAQRLQHLRIGFAGVLGVNPSSLTH